MDSLSGDIAEFIDSYCGVAKDRFNIDTKLFSTGLLDSFSLIEVISFIEEKAGIKIKARDVHLGNFDTVAAMSQYVSRCQVCHV